MAKQLNVNLSVNADVKQAKAAFEDLQKTLTKIQGSALADSKNLFNVQEIKAATEAARELQHHLAAATDVNTGRLNLSTFASSLKKSGKDLNAYKIQLEALGPSGEQAFTKVAKSIAMADNPLKRTNGLLTEFKTTLMNTARWQISSSILHGFMGALQSAYGYAQDLNESLNNIRIVTGYDVDKMAEFAAQANKAAKALSTTTTEYTNASLIYYQQGLSDAQVKERTDVTIKLANVSRQSAEEVSSQMTAVWNNFADGSKNLEYYADVITALGAATASSSDEIAEGLQKFASIADTVGLSYEKATAALATVVAETRQSADVVGTAFKTMFARLQGLSLGETLEDGVDLNKYSKALAVVGVNILDANGKLKDMDSILDETAEKWNQISEAQRVALAETVAGIRQYAQFMAIMNNYDKIQSNQAIAENSEGTIQKQADIYAESWEASSKRVKAAIETIYQSLINDKFFIGANNLLAGLLDGVNGFIKGMGGVKGLISTVAAFIGQSLAKEAPAALARITEYVTQITGKAHESAAAMQKATQQWAHNEAKSANEEFEALDTAGPNASEYMVEVNMIEMLAEKKRQYNANEAQYSAEEKARAQDEIAGLEAAGSAIQKKAQALDSLRAKADTLSVSLANMSKNGDASSEILNLRSVSKVSGQIQALSKQLDTLNKNAATGKISQEQYEKELDRIAQQAKKAGDELGGNFASDLKLTMDTMKAGAFTTDEFATALSGDLSRGTSQAEKEINTLINTLHQDFGIPEVALRNFVQTLQEIGVKAEDIPQVLDGLRQSFGDLAGHTSKTSEQLISFGSALMQINSVISSLQRLSDVFSDEDATAVEKASAVIGVITTALFAYNAIAKLTATLQAAETGSLVANIMAKKAASAEEGKLITQKLANVLATNLQTAGTKLQTAGLGASTKATWLQAVANKGLLASMPPLLAVTLLLAAAFAALVAIFAAVSAAAKLVSDWYNKDAIAAEKATEAASDLADAYKETKEAYDELKNSITAYQDAYNAISELQSGTEAFGKAIESTNEKALALINTYKSLSKEDYYIDENGAIKIKSEALDRLDNEQAKKVTDAQATMIMTQATANRAQAINDITQLKRDRHQSVWGAMGQGAAEGGSAGLIAGLATSGIASLTGVGAVITPALIASAGLIGAASKAVIKGISTAQQNAKNDKIIDDAIARLTTGDLAKDFTNNHLTDADLKQKLQIDDQGLINAIKELASDINHNSDMQELVAQQAADTALASNEQIKNSKRGKDVSLFAGEAYQSAYETGKKTYTEAYVKKNSNLALQAYASAMGLNYEGLKAGKINKKDGRLEYSYYDTEGKKQENSISIDALQDALASNEANKAIQQTGENILAALEKLSDAEETAVVAAKKKNADSLTVGSLSQSYTATDFNNLTADDIKNFGFEGVTTADQLAEMLNTQKQDVKNNLTAYATAQGQAAFDAIEYILNSQNDAFKDLSQQNLNNYASMIGNLQFQGGEAVANNFATSFNALLESNADHAKEIMQTATTIDWSQGDKAMQAFLAELEAQGIIIDENGKAWQNFASSLSDIPIAAKPDDLEKFRKDLQDLSKLAKDIKIGSIISDDDYNKILAIDKTLSHLFTKTVSGYTYTGTKDLSQVVNDAYRQDAVNQIQQNALAKEAGNKASLGNWAWYNENGEKTRDVNYRKFANGDENDQQMGAHMNQLLADDRGGETLAASIGKDLNELRNYANMLVEGENGIHKYTSDQITDAKGKLQEAYGLIADLQENLDNEAYNNIDWLTTLGSSYDSYSEGLMAIKVAVEEAGEYGPTAEETAQAIERLGEVSLATAPNLEKLDSIQQQILLNTGEASYDAYAVGLLNIAANYENCAQEAEKYQEALLSADTAAIKAAKKALHTAVLVGEQSKKYGLEAADVETQARLMAEAYDISGEAAARLAIRNQRMNKAVATLNKNFGDWNKTLTTTDHKSADYAKALNEANQALADLTGALDGASVPLKFLDNTTNDGARHLQLMEKAAKGDVAAINQLGVELASAQVEALEFKKNISEAFDAQGNKLDVIGLDKFNADKQIVLNGIDELKAKLNTLNDGDSVGDILGQDWVNALNEMAVATGMSVDQMNAYLNELGVEAQVDTATVKQSRRIPRYTTKTTNVKTNSVGGYTYIESMDTSTYQSGVDTVEETIDVAQINTGAKRGQTPKITYHGAQGGGGVSPSASKGGGGGGSGSKGTKAASHKHEVNRYSNEENLVNGLSKDYDRLTTAKDHAFGLDRIRIMEKELATLGKLKDASTDYLKAIVGNGNVDKIAKAVYSGQNIGKMIASGQFGGTIGADYKSLFSGKDASGKGVEYTSKSGNNEKLTDEDYSLAALNALFGSNIQIELDSYGNITNKDTLLDEIQKLTNKTEDAYSEIVEPSSAQETDHNRRIAYLEALKERIDQYNETAELIQEKVDEYLDYTYQMQEKNADLITSRMEHGVEMGERSLKRLERAIAILGDDIYKIPEAMAEWFSATFEEGIKADQTKASAYDEAMKNAYKQWQLYTQPGGDLDENAIDSEHAAQIMADVEDGYTALMEDVLDRIQQGREYYGDTLDFWNDKLEATTSLIEANASSLGHLQNVLGLLGRSIDYKSLGVILRGQYDVAQSAYEANKAISDEAYREWQRVSNEYNAMKQQGASKAELEEFKTAALDKAEADYYEKLGNTQASLEAALEKMNAYLENEINRIYQESEDRLVGKWGSFDALDAAMQRQHNLADEYLTKTNQLYETNTLLRKLSQDIDKTDSAAAKAKLKAFSDEIESMKEMNQLSKAELDIAKARYEVLLAQIALEEAQNAKSTVRLQRDSEGNYGYVYTADQDKVNDAEQELANKQNDLYNLVLGQTQDYTEKILQTTQERNAALQELDQQWLNGEITDYDEYLRLREDITTKYNELIKTDYENYYRAVGWLNQVGAEGQTEAWTDSFTDILYSQETFANEVGAETTALTSEINGQMEWLDGQRAYWTDEAKVGNEELGDTVEGVTTKVDSLVDSITNTKTGLIKAMATAMDQAGDLTLKFALQSDELKILAESYKSAADQANDYYQTIANWTRTEETVPNDNTDNNTGGEEPAPVPEPQPAQISSGTKIYVDPNAPIYAGPGGTVGSNGTRQYFRDGQYTVYAVSADGQWVRVNHGDTAGSGSTGWFNINDVAVRMDTGGYTGEWGDSGKLALLHQKELVLNEGDTQNLLDAISLIREISSAIDLRAAASSLSAGLNSPYYQSSSSVVEQTVTIHAEFPNATDHNEIEEAFNTLINRAAQYASKNNN